MAAVRGRNLFPDPFWNKAGFFLAVGYYLVESAGAVWGNTGFLHYLWKRLKIDLRTV